MRKFEFVVVVVVVVTAFGSGLKKRNKNDVKYIINY